jgi:hypothetical protein
LVKTANECEKKLQELKDIVGQFRGI